MRPALTVCVALVWVATSGCRLGGGASRERPNHDGVTAAQNCGFGAVVPLPDAGTGPGTGTGEGPARFEICNNGIDDDLSGGIDDGCTCTVGDVVRCFDGAPSLAGVGRCELGRQRCVAAGSTGRWDACVGSGAPIGEICDGMDDDCDLLVDEGCGCELGATQACTTGALDSAGVGVCAMGSQTCVEGADFEGAPVLAWGPCEGSIPPGAETCNGLDDDCDALVDDGFEICDLEDDDCDGAVDEGDVCAGLPETRVFTRFWPVTGSGVLPASAPLHTVRTASPQACGSGEILYEVESGVVACVPAPPDDCPDRTQAVYDADTGSWRCAPCPLLVQFGGLYGFERACGDVPSQRCNLGEVPTFDESTRTWVCAPTCNNGEYDQAYLDGRLICVPC